MACKRDIKSALTDKIVQLSATQSANSINEMFKEEVIKPSGRVFVPTTLVDTYWNNYTAPSLSPSAEVKADVKKLERQNKLERDSLYQERSRLYDQVNRVTADNPDAKTALHKRIDDVNKRIEALGKKNKLYEAPNLPNIERGISQDFSRIEKLLAYTGDDLNLKLRNIEEAQRIVNFYRDAGDFSGTSNFLFEDFNELSEEEKRFWQAARDKADSYQNQLTEMHRDVISKYTKSLPSVQEFINANGLADIDYEFLTKPVKDRDWLALQGLRISDSFFGEQVLVIDVLDFLIKKYENLGINQRRNVMEKLDGLIESIRGKHNKYEEFKQLDKDGNFTGNIIHRYSDFFFKERGKVKREFAKKIDSLIEAGDAKSISEAEKELKNLRKWQFENEIFVDYRYIPEIAAEFPEFASEFIGDDVDKSEYKAKLIKHLGEKGYNELLDRTRKNIKEYNLMLDYYQEMGEDNLSELVSNLGLKPGVTVSNLSEAMQIWKALNSPFYAANAYHAVVVPKLTIGGVERTLADISEIKGKHYTYTEEVPRKYKGKALKRDGINVVIDTSELTGYYDEKFRKVENDADLYNFWSFAIHNLGLARHMMPYKYQREYNVNSIMYMEKTVMEAFTEKGAMGLAYSSAYDAVIKSLTDRELSTESFDENPFAPNARTVNYAFLGERKRLEEKLYESKLLEFLVKEGIDKVPVNGKVDYKGLSKEQRDKLRKAQFEFRKEAKQEIAERASFDLGSVLKFHLGTMVALNQRENILPVLNAYEKTVKELKKVQTNRAGQAMTQENRLRASDLPLENILKGVSYTLDVFTGQPVQDIEAPSDKKMYKQDELEDLKRLKTLREKASLEQKEAIDKLIAQYGSNISGSGVADTALAYMRLKGLGWNVSAQIPNAAAGYFANFSMAADGRVVKMSAMRRAYNLFLHIVMPSFLRSSAKQEQIKKVKALMYKNDFMVDATSEMQKARFSSEKGFKGREEWLSPYMPTRVTEYMNQGVLAVSRLMTIEVQNNKGETKTLWDALDENLNVKPEFSDIADKWSFGGELMEKETIKIRRLIEDTHGDYSETGRQYAKRKIAGRMALFFKTWLPNAFKARFGAYKSANLFYDMPTKGRYRSYTPATAALAGASIGSWFAPGIGTLVGYGIGFGLAKVWGLDVNEKIGDDFKDSLSAMGSLLKRLVYSKLSLINPAFADKLNNQFDGKFDELDAANLRSNLQEIQNMLTLLLVYFVAKATLYDDDEDKKNQIVHNYIVNQIVKIQQDLVLYTSPQSPGKLIEQAIPVTRLVEQSFGIITSANKAIFQMELKPNEDSLGENLSDLLPRPFPSTRKLTRTYGEPKMLKTMTEGD
jgi:hypothetical protein